MKKKRHTPRSLIDKIKSFDRINEQVIILDNREKIILTYKFSDLLIGNNFNIKKLLSDIIAIKCNTFSVVFISEKDLIKVLNPKPYLNQVKTACKYLDLTLEFVYFSDINGAHMIN